MVAKHALGLAGACLRAHTLWTMSNFHTLGARLGCPAKQSKSEGNPRTCVTAKLKAAFLVCRCSCEH
eukprot:3648364-Amphidinium_carterae.1